MDHGIRSKSSMPPGAIVHGFLQVGDDIVDCGACRIVTREVQVKITPKVLAVLLELSRNEGETVARDTLLDTVWADTSPTPDVVKQAMLELRRAFEPMPIVETIPRLGYRLLMKTKFSETLEGLSKEEHDDIPNSIVMPAHQKATIEKTRYFVILSGVALTAAAIFGILLFQARDDSEHLKATVGIKQDKLLNYRLLTSDIGAEKFPSVSPDGSMIAYTYARKIGQEDKLVTRVVNARGVQLLELLPSTAEDSSYSFPVWSPDGNEIAVQQFGGRQADCQIKAFPVFGGPGRLLSKCWPELLQRFDWSSDGKALALSGMPGKPESPLGNFYIYDIDGDKNLRLKYGDRASHIDLEPKYSPDGKSVLFRRGIQPNTDLYLLNLQDNSLRKLTNFDASSRGHDWTANGSHIIFSSNHLGPFALYALRLQDNAITPIGIEDAQFPSVSEKANVLVFQKMRLKTTVSSVSLLPSRSMLNPVLPETTASDRWARISPVSSALAFISNRSGVDQVWLSNQGDTQPYQLTHFAGERLESLSWSRDGKKLLLIALSGGLSRVYEVDVDRQKISRLKFERDLFLQSVAYGGNQSVLLMIARDARGTWGLWTASRQNEPRFEDVKMLLEGARSFTVVHGEQSRIWVNRDPAKPVEIYSEDYTLLGRVSLVGAASTLQNFNNKIWYITLNNGTTELRRYSIVDKTDRQVAEIPGFSWINNHFDVARDESAAYYTRTVQDDTDIAIAELPKSIQ